MSGEEFCTSCGEFVPTLDPVTGWCPECTNADRKFNNIHTCQRCSSEFKSTTARPYCAVCRRLNWLEQHADEIEEYMETGLSFEAAREEVRSDIKPTCLGCGTPLSKNGYFCTKPSCRKLRDKLRRLRSKGLTRQQALREII